MDSLHVEYTIEHAEGIIDQIEKQVKGSSQSNYLKVEEKVVKGCLFGSSLRDDLSLYGVSLQIEEDLVVTRNGSIHDDLLIIDFHLDSFAQLFRENKESNQLIIGSYLASSDYISTAKYVPNTEARFISLIISKGWLMEHVAVNETRLIELLNAQERFFFFRENGFEIAAEVQDTYNAIYGDKEASPAYLYGCAFKILSLYFESFKLDYDLHLGINRDDLKAIEETKKFIDLNVHKKLEMSDLLEVAAMSETKFRNLFKSVFGASPFDYYLKQKLWHAKSLIEGGELISNVVSEIGYTNHSYFTRSFKELFGITPQRYREEARRLRDNS